MKVSYEIKIQGDTSIKCYEDESVLSALRRNNVRHIIYGCFGGGCGKCLVQVKQGSYKIFKKMSKEHIDVESDEKLLACCIMPQSDMEIVIL